MTVAVGRQCLWLVPRFLLAWLVYLVAVEFLLSLGAGEGFGRQLISLGPTGFFAEAPNSIGSQAGTLSAAWASVLFQATVASLWVTGTALLICLAFGPVFGVLAGRFRRVPWVELLLFPLLVVAWVPGFWIASLGVTGWVTRWGHPVGFDSPLALAGPVAVETWWRVSVVAVLVALPGIAWQFRSIAGDLKRRARDPEVAAAFARGVTGAELFHRHVIANRWEVVIRSLDRSLPAMLGVQVIVEWTLAYPGMGRLAVEASRNGAVGLLVVSGGILLSLCFLARWFGELGGLFLSPRRGRPSPD